MRLGKYYKGSRAYWFLAIVLITIFLPIGAWAVIDGNKLGELFAQIIQLIIIRPIFFLMQVEMLALPIVAQYNNFIYEHGVDSGWKMMRDLCNMFFILMLLIISFATIIRVQGYGYKQMLSRLIIMAILINFSKTIVGVFIDFSQIIMLTFVNAIKDIAAGNLIIALGLDRMMRIGGGFTVIIASILAAIFLLIAVVVVAVIIVMLFARIVYLWILTILSPLAFLSYVFPKTQGFFKKWSSMLGKQLVAGPVLAFFLWLTFTITAGNITDNFPGIAESEGRQISGYDSAGNAVTHGITEVSGFANFSSIFTYIITIGLLIGSLQIAASSGAAGASFAGQAAAQVNSRLSRTGRRLTLSPLSRAGAGISRLSMTSEGEFRKVLKFLDYTPFIGGQIRTAGMKMQGYDAMRRRKEFEEDTKYVLPTHRQAYAEMGATKFSDSDKKGLKVAGAIYSAASSLSSLGAHTDQDVNESLLRYERGNYTAKDVPRMAQHAREMGNEKMLLDLQGKYIEAYKDEGEMKRRLQLVGQDGMLNLEDVGLFHENGDPTEKNMLLEKVLHLDEKTDGRGISRAMLKRSKEQRQAHSRGSRMVEETGVYDEYLTEGLFKKDREGRVGQDEQNRFVLDTRNPAMKYFLSQGQTYPNLIPQIFRKIEAAIDPIKLKLNPGDVVNHLVQRPNESKAQFRDREKGAIAAAENIQRMDEGERLLELAKANGGVLPKERRAGESPEAAQARYAKEEALLQEVRSSDYPARREVEMSKLAEAANIVPKYRYRSIDDWKAKNKAGYDNIDISALEQTKGKENPEEFRATVEAAIKHNQEAPIRYQRKIEEMERALAEIGAEQKPDDLDQETWERRRAIRRAVVLDDPGRDTVMRTTLAKELFDGIDPSRLAELDMSNPEHREIARLYSHYATTAQQVATFNANTTNQNETYVRLLAESGRRIPKYIIDNTTPQFVNEIKAINIKATNQYLGISDQSSTGKREINASLRALFVSNSSLLAELRKINPTLSKEIEDAIAKDKAKEKKKKSEADDTETPKFND